MLGKILVNSIAYIFKKKNGKGYCSKVVIEICDGVYRDIWLNPAETQLLVNQLGNNE